ncbi:hypothetical protein L798_14938 [Zootermopsis nevadensis]|uniref:Uncharacterized protein n=2 Tax=Zootermopsis nevadensis TaxID=136037 RepID=A0A067QR73_ZOONE|nr:hypothetical protein L798_14938 [Zootermopsis nevadensis]
MIPSLVMALLSSRILVFWLLNVLLVICVAVATQRLSKDKKHENSRLPTYPYHKENLTLPVDIDKKPVEAGGGIAATAAAGLRTQSEYDYANNNNNNRPFSYTPDNPKMISRAFLHPPQASVRDSLVSSTAIPRVSSSLRSPSPEPLYLECLEPTPSEKKTNYENVREPDARTRAAVIPRISSDRSQQRTHPSAADMRRRPTSYEEARPLDRKFLQTNDDRVQDPNR